MLVKLAYLEHYVRPILARLLPADVFVKLYIKNRQFFLENLAQCLNNSFEVTKHQIELAGLTFRNDLGNAAGMDKDGSLLEFNYHLGAGFAIVGTVLSEPHTGNQVVYGRKNYNPWTPLPFSFSAINSLGLPSKGIDITLDNIKRFQDKYNPKNFPIGLSIMGHPNRQGEQQLAGVVKCFEKAQNVVDFIELNESCPNIVHRSSCEELERKLQLFLENQSLPLFIKFSSLDLTSGVIELLEKFSVTGLSLCNTQKEYTFFRKKISSKDYKIFDFYIQKFAGGLSGEVIRDYSLELIQNSADYLKKNNSKLKLMHIGGLSKYEHIEQSRKYADLRQWYTGLMEALSSQKMADVYKNILKKVD